MRQKPFNPEKYRNNAALGTFNRSEGLTEDGDVTASDRKGVIAEPILLDDAADVPEEKPSGTGGATPDQETIADRYYARKKAKAEADKAKDEAAINAETSGGVNIVDGDVLPPQAE